MHAYEYTCVYLYLYTYVFSTYLRVVVHAYTQLQHTPSPSHKPSPALSLSHAGTPTHLLWDIFVSFAGYSLFYKYLSLLQDIVFFIGLFCKRDLCFEGAY